MNKEEKIVRWGITVSGLGALCSALFLNKYTSAFNMLVFVCFSIILITRKLQLKGISLKDLDVTIESKMNSSYQEKNYALFALYALIRPIIMCGLITIAFYTLAFLIL